MHEVARKRDRLPAQASVHGPWAAVVVLVLWAGHAQAQRNAEHVNSALDNALGQFLPSQICDSRPQPPACSLVGQPGAHQLAPDKFVMLGTSALAAIQQQLDFVKVRQYALRTKESSQGIDLAPPGTPFTTSTRATPMALRRWVRVPAMLGVAGPAVDGGTSDAGVAATSSDPVPTPDLGLFLGVQGDLDRSDPTPFDPGYKHRTMAFTLGADHRIAPSLVLGAALGPHWSRSAIDTSDGATSSDLSARGVGLSLYGSYVPAANAYIDASLAFSRSRYDSRRDLPALSDAAFGITRSREYGASLGTGYAIAQGRWNYGPYARLIDSHVDIDAFTEQPNTSGTNLAVTAQSIASRIGSLGAQASYAMSQSWGVLVPNARFEWNHQFRQDKAHSIVATFAQDGTKTPIDIATTPPDRNYFALDAGLVAHFNPGHTGVLNYSRTFGRAGESTQVLTAELRLEF